MRDRRAEQLGEGFVGGLVEVFLAAEEDDLVGEEGGADAGDVGLGQVAAEPDAADLGADAAADLGDGEGGVGAGGSGHGDSWVRLRWLFPQRKKWRCEGSDEPLRCAELCGYDFGSGMGCAAGRRTEVAEGPRSGEPVVRGSPPRAGPPTGRRDPQTTGLVARSTVDGRTGEPTTCGPPA